MSKQANTSRRNFIKGAAAASALSVGGLSGLAVASPTNAQPIVGGTHKSTITLMNQSPRAVALNATQPVSVEKINGWLVVKVNKATETDSAQALTIDAGQELSLPVYTELTPIERTVFVDHDNYPASLLHATIA